MSKGRSEMSDAAKKSERRLDWSLKLCPKENFTKGSAGKLFVTTLIDAPEVLPSWSGVKVFVVTTFSMMSAAKMSMGALRRYGSAVGTSTPLSEVTL